MVPLEMSYAKSNNAIRITRVSKKEKEIRRTRKVVLIEARPGSPGTTGTIGTIEAGHMGMRVGCLARSLQRSLSKRRKSPEEAH